MKLFRGGPAVDWLIVGLGNPGRQYAHTRHNVGFMVAEELVGRWQLPRAKDRFRGRLAKGRVTAHPAPAAWNEAPAVGGRAAEPPGGTRSAGLERAANDRGRATGLGGPTNDRVRVAVLCPQTYMNEAGRSVGPARGSFKVALERVLVVHDEIDLPFGEIRSRLGGGLAGHNGLKSLKRELGSADFMRVRVGVGRPASTDPEIVSAYVLGRFSEPDEQVRQLVERAADEVQRIVLGE